MWLWLEVIVQTGEMEEYSPLFLFLGVVKDTNVAVAEGAEEESTTVVVSGGTESRVLE